MPIRWLGQLRGMINVPRREASAMLRPERMIGGSESNALDGQVVWSPVKSLWFTAHFLVAVISQPWRFTWDAACVSCVLTVVTLCCGHSVGMHRLLIHRSFQCPRWLEYVLVTAGTLVGMGGPRRMMLLHEFRDWSQRQTKCHPFFIHKSGILQDALWNLHCECRLVHPPEFRPELAITESRYYRLLDRYWMAIQLPLALLLLLVGGWEWCVAGISVRIVTSLIGHWAVGYIAHNHGPISWVVEGASVQGHNVLGLGMLTMGEAWHNNHHAFPESARLGLAWHQPDPGWWFVCVLKRLGLAWAVQLPEHHPLRCELRSTAKIAVTIQPTATTSAGHSQSDPVAARTPAYVGLPGTLGA